MYQQAMEQKHRAAAVAKMVHLERRHSQDHKLVEQPKDPAMFTDLGGLTMEW